jgi:5'-nucleotidase
MSAAVEAGLKEFQQLAFPFRLRMECRFWNNEAIYSQDHPRGFRKSFTPRSRIKRQFPKINKDNIKGIKICRQAKARWIENLINDKHHKEEITILWEFVNQDKGEDTDEWAFR